MIFSHTFKMNYPDSCVSLHKKAMETTLQTKKITPQDVFVTILEGDDLIKRFGEEAVKTMKRNRPSGIGFVDQLADLINHHKNKSTRFYEQQMNLPLYSIRSFMLVYTGMGFKQWLDKYLALAARELLIETDLSLDAIGKRLGYSGANSFCSWYVKVEGVGPSDRRRWDRTKQAKQDAELLLKTKQKLNASALPMQDES